VYGKIDEDGRHKEKNQQCPEIAGGTLVEFAGENILEHHKEQHCVADNADQG
jgi:hypothetical protein